MIKWIKDLLKPIKVKACKHENVGWCWLAQRVDYRECLDCGYGECRNETTGEFRVLKKLKSEQEAQASVASKAGSSKKPLKSKYGNEKTQVDNFLFDRRVDFKNARS